jgi:hypothetical protein
MKIRHLILMTAVIVMGTATLSQAADADQLMADSHVAYYYAGDGGHAKVEMTIVDKKGRERTREFWMLRRDLADMGDQRYYTYFIKPADVRKTSFLVHKHPDGNDDRWLYVPALDLVKRIAADDRSSSFVGSDFSYEDVSGRLPVLDNHEIVGEETLNDRAAIKVKSVPKDAGTADWSEKHSWICAESKLPLKEEYYDKKGQLVREFTLKGIETIDGFITGTVRTMKDVKRGKHTTIRFTDVSYKSELSPEDFSERLLKSPPREYTR